MHLLRRTPKPYECECYTTDFTDGALFASSAFGNENLYLVYAANPYRLKAHHTPQTFDLTNPDTLITGPEVAVILHPRCDARRIWLNCNWEHHRQTQWKQVLRAHIAKVIENTIRQQKMRPSTT